MGGKGAFLNKGGTWKRTCRFLALVYSVFLFLDVFFPAYAGFSDALKFFSIGLLFLAQCIWGEEGAGYWKGAGGLTLLTDALLLFTDFYKWGVFFFIWVQAFRYLHRKKGKRTAAFFSLSLLGAGSFFLSSFFLSPLNALCLVYGLFLLLNTGEAFHSGDRKLLWAYLLFCACDLSVAMANLPLSGTAGTIFRKLIWAFYLPSQVLLADHIMKIPAFQKGRN